MKKLAIISVLSFSRPTTARIMKPRRNDKKPVLSDYSRGVVTLPLIHALKTDETLPGKIAAGLEPARLKDVVEAAGGLAYTHANIDRLYKKTQALLKSLNTGADKFGLLTQLMGRAAGLPAKNNEGISMRMMTRLLSYVEIKTKITSVFPYLMTLAYLLLNNKQIDPLRSAVFFAGMFLFDLTATTINNYNDTKKNHQTLQFPRRTALLITLALFALSMALGIYLVALTDIVVLLAGGLCFLFGIIYSYGPIPLSHGPYGEAASGFFYGALIPFILIYINDPADLLTYTLSTESVSLRVNVMPAVGLVLLAVLPFCLTANIMLANNICDVEHDVRVNRYTLAFYLKKYALYLFALLYYAAYLSVIIMVVFRLLSPLSLILLVTLIPVQKNINAFFKKQVKEETFIVSIKNFVLIISVHIVLIFLGSLLPGWGPR